MTEEKILTLMGNKLLHIHGVCPRSLANLNIDSQFRNLNLSQDQYRNFLIELEQTLGVKFCKALYSIQSASMGELINTVKDWYINEKN